MLNQIKAVCAISHQTITMIAWLDEICASGMTGTIAAPVILKIGNRKLDSMKIVILVELGEYMFAHTVLVTQGPTPDAG